jgi:hypothetical protein
MTTTNEVMMSDFYGLGVHGRVIALFGPPGTGKSHAASTIVDVVPKENIRLLCTKANEANSYVASGLQDSAELFIDHWDPSMGMDDALGWSRLNKRIVECGKDEDVHCLIVDPGTDVAELLSHKLLKGLGVEDLSGLKKKGRDTSFDFWGQMRENLSKFMDKLIAASMGPAPTLVIVPWHVQSASEEELMADKGTQFEGKTLPMVPGSYRKRLAGDVDVAAFTDVYRRKGEVEYRLILQPTHNQHAKVRGVLGAPSHIPNNMTALMAVLADDS